MANAITQVPESVSQAGYTFNYALWTAGTKVTLLTVPWDSDYRDVIKPGFNLDGWIDSQPTKLVVENMKHARLGQPIRLSVPFERASQFNYIRATNPAQPVAGSLPSTYYYFIKSVEYGAPNTTILNLQLDVWATFINSVSFGRMYVEKGHVGIANERQMENNGRSYLTVPEGFDTGAEMLIKKQYIKPIAEARGTDAYNQNFSIMITTTADLESADLISSTDPKVVTAKGNQMENLPHGGAIYFFKSFSILESFLIANQNKSWITQSITSITAVPPVEYFEVPLELVEIPGVGGNGVWKPKAGTIPAKKFTMTSDWIADAPLPSRYQYLNKFRTYPYTVIEATTYNGQPLVLKPEFMRKRTLEFAMLLHLAPGNGRLSFIPYQYNSISDTDFADDAGMYSDSGEWLDFACTITNFPQYSTVNNAFAAFMQTNKNQIAFQHQAALWDQQRAMMGANNAAQNTTIGMNAAMQQAGNQQGFIGDTLNANLVHRGNQVGIGILNAGIGGAGQIVGGNAIGGVVNAGVGMMNSSLNGLNDITQMADTAAANSRLVGNNASTQFGASGGIRDNNLAYATQAAQGDYSNKIAGIEARVQDMKMLQPTVSGQVSGESFLLAKMGWSMHAKVKTISENAMFIIGEHWLRYGYRVHAFMSVPWDLMVMSKFTFWQTLETNVFADGCPEEYRMTIRGIMEKGVTVYNDPDDIGRVDPATNTPLEGFSY